jgi:hypothetical protein
MIDSGGCARLLQKTLDKQWQNTTWNEDERLSNIL